MSSNTRQIERKRERETDGVVEGIDLGTRVERTQKPTTNEYEAGSESGVEGRGRRRGGGSAEVPVPVALR